MRAPQVEIINTWEQNHQCEMQNNNQDNDHKKITLPSVSFYEGLESAYTQHHAQLSSSTTSTYHRNYKDMKWTTALK